MKLFTSLNHPELSKILLSGGIGVLRTDTLYGVVASAKNEAAVRRVYSLKGRDDDKSPIVLISSLDQLFDTLAPEHAAYVSSIWPAPISVIIPSTNAPTWIRRGNDSVAYRLPNAPELIELLNVTGPLIAPSANPQGMQPAMNIQEARYYFADKVDFYVDQGAVVSREPSQLMRLKPDGLVERLR